MSQTVFYRKKEHFPARNVLRRMGNRFQRVHPSAGVLWDPEKYPLLTVTSEAARFGSLYDVYRRELHSRRSRAFLRYPPPKTDSFFNERLVA